MSRIKKNLQLLSTLLTTTTRRGRLSVVLQAASLILASTVTTVKALLQRYKPRLRSPMPNMRRSQQPSTMGPSSRRMAMTMSTWIIHPIPRRVNRPLRHAAVPGFPTTPVSAVIMPNLRNTSTIFYLRPSKSKPALPAEKWSMRRPPKNDCRRRPCQLAAPSATRLLRGA